MALIVKSNASTANTNTANRITYAIRTPDGESSVYGLLLNLTNKGKLTLRGFEVELMDVIKAIAEGDLILDILEEKTHEKRSVLDILKK
ncbi:MAG: hypothetical protein JHC33_12150 [Ignisphaera sp.]|nr:hypothetical protein [Ignisphaera sp.]